MKRDIASKIRHAFRDADIRAPRSCSVSFEAEKSRSCRASSAVLSNTAIIPAEAVRSASAAFFAMAMRMTGCGITIFGMLMPIFGTAKGMWLLPLTKITRTGSTGTGYTDRNQKQNARGMIAAF